MNILGISHDVLICSAAITIDGKVISAIPEERLDRVKQSRVFPRLAIRECLRQAKLTMEDIDEIAVAWNPARDLETVPSSILNSRRWRTDHFVQVPGQILGLAGLASSSMVTLRDLYPSCPPITYVDHYLSHIGNAFFLSPYEEAAILVMDGRGEKQTQLMAVGRGSDLEMLGEVNYPHSLGLFYSSVTQFLGFKPDSDEWKVMALAAMADSDNNYYRKLRDLVSVDEKGRMHLDLSFFEFFNFSDPRMYSDKFIEVFGNPRRKSEELGKREMEVAAALQRVFQEVMNAIVTKLHARTKLDRLVVTGGCFMNSVYNGKVTTQTPFKECFITSCPDDSGTSIGAALYLEAERTGVRAEHGMVHNYWGMEFSDDDCLARVKRLKLPNVTVVSEPEVCAAADLVEGKLVGWFQGRAEFGQRALGHRSILADPRDANMKDFVNAAVKYRESFRPFAPAILAERVSDYFEVEKGTRVPFMEKVLQFRSEMRDKVPAVVHDDGTGRVQTVERGIAPRFYRLIEEFEKRAGVPIVLNTSFNLNGEPVVNTPEDAVRTFYSCGLDVLYLGNVRIAK